MEGKLLPQSFSAAITKYHNIGVLNNKHFFLTVLEEGKLKVKVLADVENPLPGSNNYVLAIASHGPEIICSSLFL